MLGMKAVGHVGPCAAAHPLYKSVKCSVLAAPRLGLVPLAVQSVRLIA